MAAKRFECERHSQGVSEWSSTSTSDISKDRKGSDMTEPTSIRFPSRKIRPLRSLDDIVDQVPHHWSTTLEAGRAPSHCSRRGRRCPAASRRLPLRGHPPCRLASGGSSELGGTRPSNYPEPEYIEARKSMLDMDPPRHDELRGTLRPALHAGAPLRVWEDKIRAVADEVIDLALKKYDESEFVAEIKSRDPDAGLRGRSSVCPMRRRSKVIDMVDRPARGRPGSGSTRPARTTPTATCPLEPGGSGDVEFGRKIAAERRKEPRDTSSPSSPTSR